MFVRYRIYYKRFYKILFLICVFIIWIKIGNGKSNWFKFYVMCDFNIIKIFDF